MTDHPACDRCGKVDGTVRVRDWCPTCDPVPQCDDCDQLHSEEIAGEDW